MLSLLVCREVNYTAWVMQPYVICHLAVSVSFHYICCGYSLLSGILLSTFKGSHKHKTFDRLMSTNTHFLPPLKWFVSPKWKLNNHKSCNRVWDISALSFFCFFFNYLKKTTTDCTKQKQLWVHPFLIQRPVYAFCFLCFTLSNESSVPR